MKLGYWISTAVVAGYATGHGLVTYMDGRDRLEYDLQTLAIAISDDALQAQARGTLKIGDMLKECSAENCVMAVKVPAGPGEMTAKDCVRLAFSYAANRPNAYATVVPQGLPICPRS